MTLGVLMLAAWIAAGSASAKVAVLAAGEDPVAADALRRRIESQLRSSCGLDAVAATEIATALGTEGEIAGLGDPSASKRREIDRLRESARTAYYEDRLVVALDSLATAMALANQDPTVGKEERATLLLWRAAVFLALKQEAQAREAVKAALDLTPELVVDLKVFRPSLAELVRRVRAQGPMSTGATAPSTPSSAGAPVPRPDIDAALSALVWRGTASVSDAALLGTIATRLRASALVLVAAQARPTVQVRSMLVWPNSMPLVLASSPLAAGSDSSGGLVEWVVSHGCATRTPAGVATRSEPTRPADWDLRARAAVVAASRARKLSGGGGGLRQEFWGLGPRLGLKVSRRWLVMEIEGQWLSYALSTEQVVVDPGVRLWVRGGWSVSGHAGLGVRYLGGVNGEKNASYVGVMLGGSWEQHVTDDVGNKTRDIRVGLFPSYRSIAAQAQLIGGYAFRAARLLGGPLLLEGAVGLSPWSQWREQPRGATGRAPRPEPALSWRANLSVGQPWMLAIGYSGELREVRFSGATNIVLVDPPIESARERETLHFLSISLARAL